MFESALSRPLNRFACEKPTLFELASFYAFGLVRNHLFVDGNKRIGFTAAVVFLELNGYAFAADEVDATIQTLALAAHELDKPGSAAWLKADAKKTRRYT